MDEQPLLDLLRERFGSDNRGFDSITLVYGDRIDLHRELVPALQAAGLRPEILRTGPSRGLWLSQRSRARLSRWLAETPALRRDAAGWCFVR